MKTAVIVGNAPLKYNFSEFIDSSDCVVRFNDCKNYGGHSGNKTDILILNNSGDPEYYRTLSDLLKPRTRKEVERSMPYVARANQVWFVRPPSALLSGFIRERIPDSSPFKESELRQNRHQRDLAAEIAQALCIPREKIRPLRALDFYTALWDKLLTYGTTEAVAPSTGMLGVEMVLSDPQFGGYRKFVTGFNWEMWPGHPGELERRMITHYSDQGQLTFVTRQRAIITRWMKLLTGSRG